MDNELEKRIQELDNAIWGILREKEYQENPLEASECIDLMKPIAEKGNDIDDPDKKARFIILLQNIINRMLPGTQFYARDCLLTNEVSALYEPGVILREPGFVDASACHGGLMLTHRVMIISNHMAPIPENMGWELHTAPRNSYYKVLSNYTSKLTDKRMILLFHLPLDGSWKIFETIDFSNMGGFDIIQTSIEMFERRHIEPVIPELSTKEWLYRCAAPVGIYENNVPYPLES